MYLKAFIILLFFILIFAAKAKQQPLFDDQNETLNLELTTDINALIHDKSEEPEYINAYLRYFSPDNEIFEFSMKVRPRGGTRRLSGYCEIPPLKFNFKKKSTTHTVFEGQDKLKFVAQCRQTEEYRQYLLEEYLLYKTYNIITEESYKVRLVNLTIIDANDPKYKIRMPGFFIEDDEGLAARLGAKIHSERVYSQDSCEQTSMNRLALFQYMIGNTDWYVRTSHNTDVFERADQALIPVPFDFDAAGVIDAIYAKPSEMIPIKNVRKRFYKGYCTDMESFHETVNLFREKKGDIYALYRSFDPLPGWILKRSLKYYDKFFQIIDDQVSINSGYFSFCEDMKTPNF
jgi:hypothetical protein